MTTAHLRVLYGPHNKYKYFLYNFNRFVIITETESVYCAVRIKVNIRVKRQICPHTKYNPKMRISVKNILTRLYLQIRCDPDKTIRILHKS